MKLSVGHLMDELEAKTARNIEVARNKFLDLPSKELFWQSSPTKWGIAHCLEHVCIFMDFYLPAIENSLSKSEPCKIERFEAGFVGNFLLKDLLPENGHTIKKDTSKNKNPLHGKVRDNIVNNFIDQQLQLLDLLEKSRIYDLNKIKVPLHLASWLKMSLGDTLRLQVQHNYRHVSQASIIHWELSAIRSVIERN